MVPMFKNLMTICSLFESQISQVSKKYQKISKYLYIQKKKKKKRKKERKKIYFINTNLFLRRNFGYFFW